LKQSGHRAAFGNAAGLTVDGDLHVVTQEPQTLGKPAPEWCVLDLEGAASGNRMPDRPGHETSAGTAGPPLRRFYGASAARVKRAGIHGARGVGNRLGAERPVDWAPALRDPQPRTPVLAGRQRIRQTLIKKERMRPPGFRRLEFTLGDRPSDLRCGISLRRPSHLTANFLSSRSRWDCGTWRHPAGLIGL
jgi:hypothetical protein